MVETTGSRIRRAREALGAARGKKFTQTELANLVGVTKAAVTQWELGQTPPHQSRRAAIAAALQCSEEWLFAEPRVHSAHASAEPGYLKRGNAGKPPAHTRRDSPTLPIRGTVGHASGDFAFTGQVVDYKRRPPSMGDSRLAYGVVMRGFAMAPIWEEGDLVYVDPGRSFQIGKYYVIELQPTEDGLSPVVVRRILFRNADTIELWQAPPVGRYSISAGTVAHMHRILRDEELICLP